MSIVAERKGLTWAELCEHPGLKDMPYHVETDGEGRIIMTPVSLWHGKFQSQICNLLQAALPEGKTLVEAAVQTPDGTKVADSAWVSNGRWEEIKNDSDAHIAPEICVEVVSPSNTVKEMKQKSVLYLAVGALEFWTCDQSGQMRFFNTKGEMGQSILAPDFPKTIS